MVGEPADGEPQTIFAMLSAILHDVLLVIDLVGRPANGDTPASGLYAEVAKIGGDTLILDITNALNNMLVGGSQLITASCDWIVPDGVYAVYLSGLGGGGGGGTGGTISDGMVGWGRDIWGVAGAGGGGGYSSGIKDKVIAVTPGSTIHVTIGQGGASDSNGGTTQFGGAVSIPGGRAGGVGENISLYSMSSYSEIFEAGNGGAGGSIGGTSGDHGWNDSSQQMWNYGGSGGTSPMFYGNYGKGGYGGGGAHGHRANTSRSQELWLGSPSSGSPGQSGCLLICWGDFRYSNVYP